MEEKKKEEPAEKKVFFALWPRKCGLSRTKMITTGNSAVESGLTKWKVANDITSRLAIPVVEC